MDKLCCSSMKYPFWRIQDGIFKRMKFKGENLPWCSVKMLLDPKIRESFGTLGLRLERIDETAPKVDRFGLGSFTDCWLPIFLMAALSLPNVLINNSLEWEFSLHFVYRTFSFSHNGYLFIFSYFYRFPILLNWTFSSFIFKQFFLLRSDKFNFEFFTIYALFRYFFFISQIGPSITALKWLNFSYFTWFYSGFPLNKTRFFRPDTNDFKFPIDCFSSKIGLFLLVVIRTLQLLKSKFEFWNSKKDCWKTFTF